MASLAVAAKTDPPRYDASGCLITSEDEEDEEDDEGLGRLFLNEEYVCRSPQRVAITRSSRRRRSGSGSSRRSSRSSRTAAAAATATATATATAVRYDAIEFQFGELFLPRVLASQASSTDFDLTGVRTER